jgi:hypothetical protein
MQENRRITPTVATFLYGTTDAILILYYNGDDGEFNDFAGYQLVIDGIRSNASSYDHISISDAADSFGISSFVDA